MITMDLPSLSRCHSYLLDVFNHLSMRLSCQFFATSTHTRSHPSLSLCVCVSLPTSSKYHRKIIVRANLCVCVFRFSEKRNFSNGNMDTFLSHANEQDEAEEARRQRGANAK